MKQHYPTRSRAIARLLCSLFLLSISVSTLYSQNRTLPTDHFRSRVSGNWSTPATWESSSDSANWTPATDVPTNQCNSIVIMASHIVVISGNQTGKYVTINSGGTLHLTTGNLNLLYSDGFDMIVYGTLLLDKFFSTTADILMKSGSFYNKNLLNDGRLNYCTWEPGSTIKLLAANTNQPLFNLDQVFNNFCIDGTGYTISNDYNFKLPASLNIGGDFSINFNSNAKIYLTEALVPTIWNIQGDINILNKIILFLSSGNSGVNLNVGGDLNIGSSVSLAARLGTGLAGITNNIVNLAGNINTLTGSGINQLSSQLNGTINFVGTNNSQEINNLGVINRVNYIIASGANLNANTLSVSPGYNLTIENGGSLITNSSIQGTMQRTLSNADWSVALDGWHLLASPVAAHALTTGGFLDTEYDFYKWSEHENIWKNQKVALNNITSFNPGEGYFVAYDNGGTKTFTGTFNLAPMTFTNLSKTETSPYSGYHLLGNPFPCAIDWGSAGWNRSSFSDVANVWNEAAMNYLPVTLTTNNIIPSNQGFFVQALSGINSITIPATARTHSNIAFNKKTEVADILHLKVVEENNGTWDETIIRIDSEATSDFDNMDGHEMQGSENAPQLYTVLAENEMLCVNALSANDIPTFIPLHFRPGAGSNYTIEVLENTIFRPIYLEDLQTGSVLLLEKTTSFSFSAADSDTRERFRLHMDPVSLPENGPHSTLSVYSSGNTIYFKDSSGKVLKGEYAVTDLTGKVLHCGILYNRSLVTIQLHNRPTGVYLVAVTLDDRQEVYKIYLQN